MIYVIFMIVVLGFIDVETKLTKLLKKNNKILNKKMIEDVMNKPVDLIISNEEISNSHLFSSVSKVKGIIKDCDDTWVSFEYHDKKETVIQYFRIKDITSINEIN